MSPMSSLDDSDAIRPRVTDIIVGRGPHYHPGNIWFRAYIKTKKQQYQLITDKTEKNQFVTSVSKEIIGTGRCFYKKVSNNYCIVGEEEQFKDGHFILHKKLRQQLNEKTAATTKAAIVNDDSSNNANCDNVASTDRGMFLYFQKMKDDNKEGKLSMSTPRKEKDKYRHILSEAGSVKSQLNICIDTKYQLYIIKGLHNTPHAAEDNCERERCCHILQRLGCNITEMSHHDRNGVQQISGEAANYTSNSAILQEHVSTTLTRQWMEDLAKYILENGCANKNRDVGDQSKRIYIGFGQIQRSSKIYHGEKIPTFNATHLQQLHPDLQVVLAKMMSFSQKRLDDFDIAGQDVNDRSTYVRQKWQEFYNINNVKVDWNFELLICKNLPNT